MANYGYLAYLFTLALLGHCAGDFWTQPKAWALNKSQKSLKGLIFCTLHVAVYSFCICVFWHCTSPLIYVLVFAPHWLIDRYILAEMWLRLIRGRTYHQAAAEGGAALGFYAVVYTVTDNSMHLVCLWAVIYFWSSKI